MKEHRYILEPYKTPASRYDCPGCGKRKTLVRYIDTQTGEHLHESVGRCNREINCGYHYTPKQYFQDNRHLFDTSQPKQYTKPKASVKPQPKPVSFIPFEIFEKSLQQYEENIFLKFLYNHFNKFHGKGATITNGLIEKYFIGTLIPEQFRAKEFWRGGVIFYEIDTAGHIFYGSIMQYSSYTGKRSKYQNTVHSLLKLGNYKRCLFGAHLLNLYENKNKTVALFEAPKTAAIASIYFPEMICLACGGLQGLSPEKCKILQGRSVILFPDLNGFEKWEKKAREISRLIPGIRFTVSSLLERKATENERQQGLDLADYLIQFDYRDFQQQDEKKYEITYEDKIGKMLLDLQMEEIIYCPEENAEKFTKVVKSYIDRNFGRIEKPSWEIIFSDDYSRIKKIPRYIFNN